MLACKDHIQKLLASAPGEAAPDSSSLIETVRTFAGGAAGATAVLTAPHTREKQHAEPSGEQSWTIRFRPNRAILACGGSPVLLFRNLRRLGACQITAHPEDVPPLEEIQPDACYLWWTITLRTAADRNVIRDVFLFVDDGSDLELQQEAAPTREQGEPAEDAASAGTGPQAPGPAADGLRKALARESTVRVPAAKLDRLVNLVGELVMNQSRLVQAAAHLRSCRARRKYCRRRWHFSSPTVPVGPAEAAGGCFPFTQKPGCESRCKRHYGRAGAPASNRSVPGDTHRVGGRRQRWRCTGPGFRTLRGLGGRHK